MSRPDTSASRPSQTKCPAPSERGEKPNLRIGPEEMCGATAHRPLSADGASLREEAVLVETADGHHIPAGAGEVDPNDPENTAKARPWYKVVNEWRDWYQGYESKHITFERDDGKTARTRLENSYQPGYANRYYAKLKGLEREIEREYTGLTTAMLTFSAATLSDDGNPRCPADHMREIQEGWNQARKELYRALSGFEWEYARVWEPTSETGRGPAGYGHLHVAVFVNAGADEIASVNSGTFETTMKRYCEAVEAAHPAAHRADGSAVSVNHSVNNVGSYISEYIGSYGEKATEREMHEQQFYATVWATATRRVSFSQGANELIRRDRERQEREERRETTETRPEDRGDSDGGESDAEPLQGAEWVEGGEDHEWDAKCVCTVASGEPHRSDPTTGGVTVIETEPRDGVDPPRGVSEK